MRIYLSCVMTAAEKGMEKRVRELALDLRRAGHSVVNPWEEQEEEGLRSQLRADLDCVRGCDLLVVVYEPDAQTWGSGMEVGVAFDRGIAILVTVRNPVDVSASLKAVADSICYDGMVTVAAARLDWGVR